MTNFAFDIHKTVNFYSQFAKFTLDLHNF